MAPSGTEAMASGTSSSTKRVADFVLAARFGHFNGLEGFCTTELVR